MTATTVPTSSTLLVRHGDVVTLDPSLGTVADGDVLVRDGVVVAVGHDLPARPGLRELVDTAETVDARGTVVVPGFVDAHVHAWEGVLRGLAPTADFGAYLGLTAFGFGPHFTPRDVYAGTVATALSALDAGITTMVDNAHCDLTPDHARAGIDALRDTGIRGVHAVGSPFGATLEHVPATAAALRDRGAGPLVGVRLFDIDPTPELWAFARDAGLWVSSETGPHTPDLEERFEALARAGLLTAQHALNHCYDLPDRVWQLIADSGATVNLCPRSDARYGLGSAIAPVGSALRHAAAVGLSNDNETSYRLSMFAEMQALLLRDRAEQFRRAAAGLDARPDALDPEQVLRFATVGGAANAGLADTVGSLSPGRQADLLLVRTDRAAQAAGADPVAAVVEAHPGQVESVFVAGRARKWAGRLVGVDDAAVRELLSASRDRVGAAAAVPA
ncbi:amidohydrolase family protein [Jatrophihabitans fulvus]